MKIEQFKDKSNWIAARGIGGTDLYSIINKQGKWGDFITLYDKLTAPTLNGAQNAQKGAKNNIAMENGKRAEQSIRELFLIARPDLTNINPACEWWLVRSKTLPELTISPDTLVKDTRGNIGFVELKLKQFYNADKIADYLTDLKDNEPQYYWQLIHYFVVIDECQFGYIVVAFNLLKKDDQGHWQHDKYIIDSAKIERADVTDDIELARRELTDFITNNLKAKKRPRTLTENQQKKENKIEWIKLSNIQRLKH